VYESHTYTTVPSFSQRSFRVQLFSRRRDRIVWLPTRPVVSAKPTGKITAGINHCPFRPAVRIISLFARLWCPPPRIVGAVTIVSPRRRGQVAHTAFRDEPVFVRAVYTNLHRLKHPRNRSARHRIFRAVQSVETFFRSFTFKPLRKKYRRNRILSERKSEEVFSARLSRARSFRTEKTRRVLNGTYRDVPKTNNLVNGIVSSFIASRRRFINFSDGIRLYRTVRYFLPTSTRNR